MRYSSTIYLIRGLKARLTDYGFDVNALSKQAALEENDCVADNAIVLSDKLSYLWELLIQASDDPLLGLKIASPQLFGRLGLMGHIILISPDVKTAIENLVRYSSLVSPLIDSGIVQSNHRTHVTLQIRSGQRTVPQQRYDFVWCMLLRSLRWATAHYALRPVLVTYAFPQPAAAQHYVEAFGCPVHFDMPANTMEFMDGDLAVPIPTAQQTTADWSLRMIAELAESQRDWTLRMLARFEQAQHDQADSSVNANFTSKVQHLLASLLHLGEPLREDIAKQLAMSERTLQRRLAEEHTSFTKLVDDTRREMAQQYLRSGQLSLKKLSFQLGFSEPSTFYRACKRWFGRSPTQLQQKPWASNIIYMSTPGSRTAVTIYPPSHKFDHPFFTENNKSAPIR